MRTLRGGVDAWFAPGQLYQRPLHDLLVRVADCPLMPGSPLIREERPHERDLF
jgi:hypothetical protein